MPNDIYAPGMTSSAIPSVATTTTFTEILPDAGQAAAQPPAGPAPVLHYLIGDTRRINWGFLMGQHVLTLPWAIVTPQSRVFVAISEINQQTGGRFIAAARYTVHNIAPRAGAVDIWVNIEWGANIPLVADYLLVQP